MTEANEPTTSKDVENDNKPSTPPSSPQPVPPTPTPPPIEDIERFVHSTNIVVTTILQNHPAHAEIYFTKWECQSSFIVHRTIMKSCFTQSFRHSFNCNKVRCGEECKQVLLLKYIQRERERLRGKNATKTIVDNKLDDRTKPIQRLSTLPISPSVCVVV